MITFRSCFHKGGVNWEQFGVNIFARSITPPANPCEAWMSLKMSAVSAFGSLRGAQWIHSKKSCSTSKSDMEASLRHEMNVENEGALLPRWWGKDKLLADPSHELEEACGVPDSHLVLMPSFPHIFISAAWPRTRARLPISSLQHPRVRCTSYPAR
jgi:hypothetical protein